MSYQQACSGPETLVPGALRVYRTWKCFSPAGAGVLFGHYQHAWTDAEQVAECARTPHVAPHDGCTCGIYGWYRPESLIGEGATVFGVVEVSGRVLLGDSGVRAEKARLLAIAAPPWLPVADRQTLARFARIPSGVVAYPTREALLSDYPPQDVTELLGRAPVVAPSPLIAQARIIAQAGSSMKQFGEAMERMARLAGQSIKDFETALRDLVPAPPPPAQNWEQALEAKRNRPTPRWAVQVQRERRR